MSPGSSTESYPAFARIGLRENPGKNLNQVTCPDRELNPGHLVSRPDALTVAPQVTCPDRDSNPGHLVSRPDALTVIPQEKARKKPNQIISPSGNRTCAQAQPDRQASALTQSEIPSFTTIQNNRQ
ncbi:hypothetical protein ANN_10568 [Periplaneta americana]|uniref:Uncharacterized protein n=1 Tax=Periplaneta americana TaxID=6978 RepID=A0ABQ8TS58_PERAM|nr:hypothetical protein ANN_10568 [Periplaneta americana]